MLDRIKRKLLANGAKLHSFTKEQAEKRLFEELASFPLFREEKLLCCPLEEIPKQKHEAIVSQLKTAPKETRYLFYSDTLSKTSALYKWFEAEAVILELTEEKAWEKEKAMTEWLLFEAEKGKKRISYQAVNALVKGSERSYAYLANEWEKLLLYTAGRDNIEEADLDAISLLQKEENQWGLGDALLQRDGKKALEIAFYLIDQGSATIQLLRQMRHQLYTVLKTALHQQEGTLPEWMEQNPYLKGGIVDKQLKSAAFYGVERLYKAVQLIDQYEFKAKDSQDQPKLLLTQLIGRIV